MQKCFTLSNNLKVVYTQHKGLQSLAVSLRVIAGSVYESPQEIGVAHFLEHLVFDGTEKYPSQHELSKYIDSKGAFRNGMTNRESINYVVKVLKDDAQAAFEYIEQIVSKPLLPESEIEKEKKIIEQEINRIKSDPKLLSNRLIYSLIYPNTRLGILNTGEMGDIEKITKESIHKYWGRTHVSGNMIVSIVGDLPLVEIKNLSQKYLSGIRKGIIIDEININAKPINEWVENISGIKQATLLYGYSGYKMSEKERYVLHIISLVLTRGKSSRLNLEIRERNGFAYSISSECISGRNHGLFYISIGLSESNIDACKKIIEKEINSICHNHISHEELQKVLRYIKSDLVFLTEDPIEEASIYSNYWCNTGKMVTVNEIFSEYESVVNNPDYILEVARKTFNQKPSILLIQS